MPGLSDERKQALATGRREAAQITAYLKALEAGHDRGVTKAETLERRISRLQDEIAAEQNVLNRVKLIQRRFDAEDKLKGFQTAVDMDALEAGFVGAVVSYSARKNIGYHTWREAGVPARVLKAAGVKRTRRM